MKTADFRRLAKDIDLASAWQLLQFLQDIQKNTNDEQLASDLQCMGSHYAVGLRAALRSERTLRSPVTWCFL